MNERVFTSVQRIARLYKKKDDSPFRHTLVRYEPTLARGLRFRGQRCQTQYYREDLNDYGRFASLCPWTKSMQY